MAPICLAPEVFLGRGYTSALDCWALGVLTWEVVADSLPWASSEKGDKWREIVVYEAILAGLPLFPGWQKLRDCETAGLR